MRTFWYRFGQCTWGILQTLLGFLVFLACLRAPHEAFLGSVLTRWRLRSGLSLGLFIFVPDDFSREKHMPSLVRVHEYGHSIQSLILGPLYLLVIGLPSFLWANLPCFDRLRAKRGISYYTFYPEIWANRLGGKKMHLQKEILFLK